MAAAFSIRFCPRHYTAWAASSFEALSNFILGGNIFEACVSRLCFITEKVDLILGRMSETGNRIPGLIDKFSAELDVHKIIARVANDLDISGDSLTGCRLYILSGVSYDRINKPHVGTSFLFNSFGRTSGASFD